MHVVKILDYMNVRYSIEGLTEVNKCCKNCMRMFQVKRSMGEVQELYEVMDDRRSFNSILTWIHVGTDYREQPFSNKGFIDFAKEEGLGDRPKVIFTFWWEDFGNRYLGLSDQLPSVLKRRGDFVENGCNWSGKFWGEEFYYPFWYITFYD